jgi:hypothetical protein
VEKKKKQERRDEGEEYIRKGVAHPSSLRYGGKALQRVEDRRSFCFSGTKTRVQVHVFYFYSRSPIELKMETQVKRLQRFHA